MSPRPEAEAASAWLRRPLLAAALLSLLVFGPAVGAGFVWDDLFLVEALPRPGLPVPWSALLGVDLAQAGLASGGEGAGYFRPLLLLGLWAEATLGGAAAPNLGHLHSLLWQLLALAGLDAWARREGLGPAARALSLVIFGLHPLQVEPVVWISARADLMLSAASLWALARGAPTGPRSAAVLAGLGLLAGLAKDQGALLPLALVATSGPRAAGAAGIGVGLAWLLRAWAGVGAPPAGLADAAQVLPTLLQISARDVLLPLELHPGEHLAWSPPPPALPLVGLLLGLLLVVLAGKGAALRGLGVATLAYLPASLAVGGLGLVGLRYHHLPLAGLALALGAAVDRGLGPRPTAVLVAALALPLAALSARALPGWASDAPFWEAAVARHPNAYTYAGRALDRLDRGELDAAAPDLHEATLGPRPMRLACEVIAEVHLQRGDLVAAAAEGRRALAAGCPPTAGLLGPTAAALVGVGAVDAAAQLARAMPEDPRSFGLLVRIADEARRGASDALAGAPPEARAALAGQAAALLEAGGEQAAAERLRAAASSP
ncbi:MAG: hypothetical protein JNM72_26590 [Deltaproteobacteria bacterium]|nr:hypothetical protein [Deltaproteobacteria bacterium]